MHTHARPPSSACAALKPGQVLLPLFWNIFRLESGVRRWGALGVVVASLVFNIVKTTLVGMAPGGFDAVAGGAAFTIAFVALSTVFVATEVVTVASVGRLITAAKAAPAPTESKETEAKGLDVNGKPKVKVTAASLKRLFGLALAEWRILTIGMVALFINALTQLAMPYVFGVLVDSLDDPNDPYKNLNQSVVLLVIIFAVGAVFGMIRGWLFTLAGQRVCWSCFARRCFAQGGGTAVTSLLLTQTPRASWTVGRAAGVNSRAFFAPRSWHACARPSSLTSSTKRLRSSTRRARAS